MKHLSILCGQNAAYSVSEQAVHIVTILLQRVTHVRVIAYRTEMYDFDRNSLR
jgi:hypothetical protein